MRSPRLPALFLGSALVAALLVPSASTAAPVAQVTAPVTAAAAAAAATSRPTVRLTHEGRTLTARFQPVALRAPSFEVLVQGTNGRYRPVQVQGERSFLGTVDGDRGAVASAIRRSDGVLAGQVTFASGGTWFFEGAEVTDDRGLDAPTFRYPSSDDPVKNRTVAPGQVGPGTYRWDVAYDVDASWFFDADSGRGSIARTLDAVELTTVSLLNSYLVDAKLRPAVGRVVIRASKAASPYTGAPINGTGGDALSRTRTVWKGLGRQTWDDVALLYVPGPDGSGGGTAYVGTAGTDYGVARNAGEGLQRAIVRHELGHTWGPSDNHTNGPEGATIMSGNAYDRFDGTELSSMMRHRNEQQADEGSFTRIGTTTQPLPPYAALDLLPDARSLVPRFLPVTANDHDANNDALGAPIVAARSALGGALKVTGKLVRYIPPRVRTAGTIDTIRYLVRDSTGRAAAGVVIVKVSPS